LLYKTDYIVFVTPSKFSRATVLRKFVANENAICQMFIEKAELN